MTVPQLNQLLAKELGTNPYSEPLFQWDWSENLFWPHNKTGNFEMRQTKSGLLAMQTEYVQGRMTRKYKTSWLITKWLSPEQLTDWERIFPSAPYPSRGYRIQTNWVNRPHYLPSLEDTREFIKQIKDQRSMSARARLEDMNEEKAREEASVDREIEDQIRDSFPAGLNPFPGKRGGSISWQGGIGTSPQEKDKV